MTTPPPGDGPYPESSQAITALVLGILGLVVCPILGPIAWQIGQKELQAIDGGLRSPQNRSNANAGRILGIVGTVLLGVSIVAILFVMLAGGIAIMGSR